LSYLIIDYKLIYPCCKEFLPPVFGNRYNNQFQLLINTV